MNNMESVFLSSCLVRILVMSEIEIENGHGYLLNEIFRRFRYSR